MIRLDAAALTDPGRERKVNEDRAWSQIYAPSEGEQVGLFIVCDGVGGHMGGECASNWAVETIKNELANLFCPEDPRETVQLSKAELVSTEKNRDLTRQSGAVKMENQVVQAVQRANQVVYAYAQQKPLMAADAGTTVTMAVVRGNRAIIANVGDSRTYLVRDHQLRQITEDHSLVATLIASGQIEPEEIYVHPQRNLILRSLGSRQDVRIDTFWEVLLPGDYLLLCSDGLWEMIQDNDLIVRLIEKSGAATRACQSLVDAANTAGGEDNIGVVVVKVT